MITRKQEEKHFEIYGMKYFDMILDAGCSEEYVYMIRLRYYKYLHKKDKKGRSKILEDNRDKEKMYKDLLKESLEKGALF